MKDPHIHASILKEQEIYEKPQIEIVEMEMENSVMLRASVSRSTGKRQFGIEIYKG